MAASRKCFVAARLSWVGEVGLMKGGAGWRVRTPLGVPTDAMVEAVVAVVVTRETGEHAGAVEQAGAMLWLVKAAVPVRDPELEAVVMWESTMPVVVGSCGDRAGAD